MSDLPNRLLMGRLPPMAPRGIGGRGTGSKGATFGRSRDYTPVNWDQHFTERENVVVNDSDTFHVYKKGTEGPVCLFLHGGGFSGLSWAVLSTELSSLVECRCVALDLRGHGNTKCEDEANLSADVLASDVGKVVQKMYGDDPPPIILVGHSMGGAIAVHTVTKDLLPSCIGLMVIDVVEGTALDALSAMNAVLRNRPKTFNTLENAIEWATRTGYIKNLSSAKVSMIGQLKRIDNAESATAEVEHNSPRKSNEEDKAISTIAEDEAIEEETKPTDKTSKPQAPQYQWRIDLAKTEPHWRGWFQGLSSLFLSASPAKLLILAGVDRLDKDLTVGQMQGKFQMIVLPKAGHAVHEDAPERVADTIKTFIVRHKLAAAKVNDRPFPGC